MMRLTLVLLLLGSKPAAANMAQVNGLAAGGEVQEKWFWDSWFAPAVDAAKEAAEKAQKLAAEAAAMAAEAAAKAKEAFDKATKMAADAKKAADEAAQDPSTTLLRESLKAAGTCPTLVAASNDFLKNSIPDLVLEVAKQLLGDCKDLKSAECATHLSELTAGLLVESTAVYMGVPAAKQVLSQTNVVTSSVGKFVTQVQCNINAVKGSLNASAELQKVLPDGAMDSIDDLSKNVNLVDSVLDEVQKMLAPANALVKLWDMAKATIKEVLKLLGSRAIAQVQPHIPDSVQKQVDAQKEKFIAELTTYLQENLGDAFTTQLEKYCPDATSKVGDEGAVAKLGDQLNSLMELEAKIKKKLDDTDQQIKDEMKEAIMDMVDKLKDEFPASSGSNVAAALAKLSEDLVSCNIVEADQKYAVIPQLQGKDFPMQFELEGLRDIMDDDMPAPQKEHLAKLHLQNTEARAISRKLGEDNERLAEALNARKASIPASSPPAFGAFTLCMVAAAMFLAGISVNVVRRHQAISTHHRLTSASPQRSPRQEQELE